MTQELRVETARPDERERALTLVFQHLGEAERSDRVRNALQFLNRGELNPDGIFVVRRRGVAGAMLCLPAPGACGLVWPAQTSPPQPALEDALLRHAANWLRRQGSKLGQCLLTDTEQHLGPVLVRNGFPHVTDLWYMRHNLSVPFPWRPTPERLRYSSYSAATADEFRRTLLKTYEGTRDCPELNGSRSVDEILEGHRTQGVFDPDRWWLAEDQDDNAVGLILLTEVPETEAWDVAYVGVVPEARRRGYGREMLQRALGAADAADAAQVTLSVDDRNHPAWDLYLELGFRPVEKRHVYLAVWR
jgi:ribosomal protein S18 acetylase RimI-like enzyme